MKKIKAFINEHITGAFIVCTLISALAGWLVSFVMPSKSVSVNNLPNKEITCTLNFSHGLVKRLTSDQKLQIIYDGEEVDTPYLYDITVLNSGSYEISNEDFKENFVIDFRGCGKVLSAQIHSSSNQSVNDEILSNATIVGENVVFSDFFLNPNEAFSVTVITDHCADDITYHSRISGMSSEDVVPRNTQKEQHDKSYRTMIIMFCCEIVFVLGIAIYIICFELRTKKNLHNELEKYRAAMGPSSEGSDHSEKSSKNLA